MAKEIKPEAVKKAAAYIKQWLDLYHARHDIPGFAVGIAHEGKTVFRHAWGYADLARKEKLTAHHAFRIASQSKIFTAVAVLQLAETGKLNIKDSIGDYLPWVRKNKRLRRVTILDLLSHGGGVRRDGIETDFWILENNFPGADFVKEQIQKHGYVQNRGRSFKYSNLAYALLGQLIEAVSGESYARYVTRNILKPLQLRRTAPDWSPSYPRRLAMGHGRKARNGKREKINAAISIQSFTPAAGFVCTLDNVLSFGSALAADDDTLISTRSKKLQRRAQWKVQNFPNRWYGLGVNARKIGKDWAFGHGGEFLGHRTTTLWHCESRTVVTVMMNTIDGAAGELAEAVFGLLLYFGHHGIGAADRKLRRYEGCYENIWGVCDFQALGGGLHMFYPDSDNPAAAAVKLPRLRGDHFLMKDVAGFDSPGETIRFLYRSGKKRPSALKFGGTRMKKRNQG